MLNEDKYDDLDRQTSLLTKRQREYLAGDGTGMSDSAQSQHRRQIRKRVKSAILDFTLLFEEWDEDERERVFDEVNDEWSKYGRGLADMFALVYLETFLGGRFKNTLSRGVNKAEKELADSDTYRVKTTFEVEPASVRNLEEVLERTRKHELRNLSDDEKIALVNLLRYSDVDVWKNAKENLNQMFDEYQEENADAHKERAKAAREKQGRRDPTLSDE